MTRFKDLRIKHKLTAVILLTSTVALGLAVLAFVGYEILAFRGERVKTLTVLADVLVKAPDGRAVHFFPSLSFEFGGNVTGPILQPTLGGNFHHPLPSSVGSWIQSMAARSPMPGVSGNVISPTLYDAPPVTRSSFRNRYPSRSA